MSKLLTLKNKSSLLIFSAILLFELAAALLYQNFVLENQEPETDYVPGEVVIFFSNGISYQDAKKKVESLGLTFPTTTSSLHFFQAEAYAHVDDKESLEAITASLNRYTEISSVKSVSSPGQEKDKLHIWFSFDITQSQAKTILDEVGLKLDRYHRWDMTVIKVPKSKELYYIEQLKQLPGVEDASLNWKFKLGGFHHSPHV